MIDSAMRERTKIGAVPLPELLVEAFDGDAELLAWVGALRESWLRYIAKWVMEPKGEEARERRAAQMAERLLLTMEAEVELPPWLARRLKGTRDAMAGWERFTRTTRMTHLMVLFGCRSEGARERQLVRVVEACVARGRTRQRQHGSEG